MNPLQCIRVSTILSACGILVVLVFSSVTRGADIPEFRVIGGTVKFTAVTNVSVLDVRGQSNQMTATLRLHREGNRIEMNNVHARVDPKTFTTGMSLRDQHLRKKVFALENDTMPELEFVTDQVTCPEWVPSQTTSCPVSGQLTVRGVIRPFTINLMVSNDGKGYRVIGAGTLKLSTFGIERPCQLGVCVTDEVKLTLDFQARENSSARTAGGF